MKKLSKDTIYNSKKTFEKFYKIRNCFEHKRRTVSLYIYVFLTNIRLWFVVLYKVFAFVFSFFSHISIILKTLE